MSDNKIDIIDNCDNDWETLLNELNSCDDDTDNKKMLYSYNNIKNNIDLEVKVDLSKQSILPQSINENDDDSTQYNYSNEKNHNTNDNSFMQFNIVGKQSYCLQRSFMKTCANYSSYGKNNSRKEINNYIYQYEGKKIPNNAIKLALELFNKIKEHGNVYRGSGKKGVIGSCIFYACVMVNMSKTPKEIAIMINIEDRFISEGDRKLQKLNEKGVITIPTILRPILDYIDQYFPALEIPYKYKEFIIDIIERAEKKDIHIKNDGKPTTFCSGAIYLLVTQVASLKHITKVNINKECSPKPSTFIKYYNLLLANGKILRPVFKKHKISMPLAWKNIK